MTRIAAAEPAGFVTIAAPFALFFWLKIAAAVAGGALAVYPVAHWLGHRDGYAKRQAEELAATARLNADLARQAADLAAERAQMAAERAAAASSARGTLADFPAGLRKECAAKCSMPAQTRKKLEAIR